MAVSAVNLASYMDEVFPASEREPITSRADPGEGDTPLPGSFDIELLTRHGEDGQLLDLFGPRADVDVLASPAPIWRTRQGAVLAAVAGAFVLLLLVVGVMRSDGEPAPTPTPKPESITIVADPEPPPPAEDEERTIAVPVAPEEPAEANAAGASERPSNTNTKSKKRPEQPAKRKRRAKKRKKQRADGWDPNSALPPS